MATPTMRFSWTLLWMSALLGVGGTPAWGQQPEAPRFIASDSARPLILGYDRLVQHYRSLQRIIADDTVAAKKPTTEEAFQRLEIDGLVVDETRSKLGRDFYEAFYGLWTAPEGAFNFTVTIQERIVPNLGTRVIVQVNSETVYQMQLSPRYEVIEAVARQAVRYARRALRSGLVKTQGRIY